MRRNRVRATVLVVDDDERFTDVMQQSLTQLNYAGATCNDPIEALNLFSSIPATFDIVMVDENMPNMQGRDLAIALLRVKDDLPVILMADNVAPPQEAARSAGVRAVLVKPVQKDELQAVLEMVLSKARRKVAEI